MSEELRDGSWREDAACRETFDPIFFDRDDRGGAKARKVCQACPVQLNCLEYAIVLGVRFGVWGGKTRAQRDSLRRRLLAEAS